jgi:UDP-N-acetylmuramate--L-alanine ligase
MIVERAWYHFAGVAGSGMSALAQFHAFTGGRATGSDRAFDSGQHPRIRQYLENAGIQIRPQDGSGLEEGCDALIVSTAVEDTVPDVAAARRLGISIIHRSELLACHVREHETIAVTGTSGKSTVVAMIFEILRGSGRDPSVITGGNLLLLEAQGHLGNAWVGRSDLLVVEADESDGSLVRYEPRTGVLLNLERDHKEPEELAEMFRAFRSNTRGAFLAGEDENLGELAGEAVRFGLGEGCDVRAERIELRLDGSSFFVGETPFSLPVPGLHNVKNAVAAIAAARSVGVDLHRIALALARFRGVSRRFQTIGRARGIEVIDDFAHNPSKIAVSLATARPRGKRILAVFQPHGFAPTRFIRDELVETLARMLRPSDRLWMPEIFYAGGTVSRDISSREIIDELASRGVPAEFAEGREDLIDRIGRTAREGDVVLVMGARDPSLSELCREILRRLGKERDPGVADEVI